MKRIFKNATLLPAYGFENRAVTVAVENHKILSVGEEPIAPAAGDEIIDCQGNLLIPGFYNVHCHAAMTLFRGYGEDLPLQRWLEEKIFPAEDRLTSESVYWATKLAIAEMLRGGVVSFSDMYFFEDDVARAVSETGIKANLSRCIVSFDPDADLTRDYRINEALSLCRNWNGASDGKIRTELALHAEYSNHAKCVSYVAELAKELNAGIHIHLSETEKEHNECIGRNGKTPTAFFNDLGAFDVPVTAAHCCYVTDEDIAILAEKKVTAVHNPVSNLKLGSGVMPLRKMLDAGVRVAFGTDGAASNNRLDLLREYQTACVLHKGVNRDPVNVTARELFPLLTRNGAVCQGREDCGEIRVGNRADFVLIDRETLHNIPCYDDYTMLAYSVDRNDVRMTVVDGSILYRDGEYTSLDEERLRFESRRVIAHYFD